MTADRDLLIAAAGAFGIPAPEDGGGYLFAAPGELSTSGWGIVTWMGYGTVQFWNPFENNDDALRLLVKLKLKLYGPGYAVTPEGRPCVEEAGDGVDEFANTRRAIVRAAAALATG